MHGGGGVVGVPPSSSKYLCYRAEIFWDLILIYYTHVGKISGQFIVYFLNYAPLLNSIKQSIITFDRIVVLTLNLNQIFVMTKIIGWRNHFSWWCHKSIMARQKWKNYCLLYRPCVALYCFSFLASSIIYVVLSHSHSLDRGCQGNANAIKRRK